MVVNSGGVVNDSGVGEDGLSAYVIRAGGWLAAELIHEVINDIIHTSFIPVVWRGGKLVVLYKGKGSAGDVDNYRGILVSDHLSKVLTSLLQSHLKIVYMKVIGETQFGNGSHQSLRGRCGNEHALVIDIRDLENR